MMWSTHAHMYYLVATKTQNFGYYQLDKEDDENVHYTSSYKYYYVQYVVIISDCTLKVHYPYYIIILW